MAGQLEGSRRIALPQEVDAMLADEKAPMADESSKLSRFQWPRSAFLEYCIAFLLPVLGMLSGIAIVCYGIGFRRAGIREFFLDCLISVIVGFFVGIFGAFLLLTKIDKVATKARIWPS
jgi:hypothetical protein